MLSFQLKSDCHCWPLSNKPAIEPTLHVPGPGAASGFVAGEREPPHEPHRDSDGFAVLSQEEAEPGLRDK